MKAPQSTRASAAASAAGARSARVEKSGRRKGKTRAQKPPRPPMGAFAGQHGSCTPRAQVADYTRPSRLRPLKAHRIQTMMIPLIQALSSQSLLSGPCPLPGKSLLCKLHLRLLGRTRLCLLRLFQGQVHPRRCLPTLLHPHRTLWAQRRLALALHCSGPVGRSSTSSPRTATVASWSCGGRRWRRW